MGPEALAQVLRPLAAMFDPARYPNLLRGLDAPEALQRVDRYLYDGMSAGRERLGIIHGKGAGILSQHVRKMLKDHPLVESFRYGEYGEGDYGVTVVTLKQG